MAFNGSGTFARLYNWTTDRDAGTKIRADRSDAEMDGFATGLSNCICRDGQSTVSANIPFNNKKITGLGDATSAADALNRQSGDARYLQRPSTLTGESNIADADVIGFYDDSATADRKITYAQRKTDLTTDFQAAGTMTPAGTKTVFYQAAAPTGWTKDTTAALNNAAIRLQTGTSGGSTGGTANFTTVFDDRTILKANLPNYTLSDTLSVSITNGTSVLRVVGASPQLETTGTLGVAQSTLTASMSGSVTSGGSGTAMDFAVKYADMIVATKD